MARPTRKDFFRSAIGNARNHLEEVPGSRGSSRTYHLVRAAFHIGQAYELSSDVAEHREAIDADRRLHAIMGREF